VVEGGVSAARISAWRPIAQKLLVMAGSGRILEGHILALIDASQGSPGEIAMIEEVGEALLRYQALAKTSDLRSTREIPRVGMRTPTQPPITTPTSAPVPEKVVSFDFPSQPPQPPPARQSATPPDGLALGSKPQHRTSNVHFRCPKCNKMVAANDAGVCPTCSTRPPSAVLTAEERPPSSIWARLGIAFVVMVAAFVLFRLGACAVGRLAHPLVSGTYPARAIGLQLTFVEDWRRNTEGRANLGTIGLDEAAVARFSRGDGDLAVAAAPRPPDFTDARLGQLADSGPDKMAGPLRSLSGAIRLDTCIASGRRMRCLGADGDRRAAAYLVLLPKQVVVMVMSSTRNLEEITAEADVLVDSLRPL
jgi:hypothetical protein